MYLTRSNGRRLRWQYRKTVDMVLHLAARKESCLVPPTEIIDGKSLGLQVGDVDGEAEGALLGE